MNILAFDTTFDHCSVALLRQDEMLAFDIESLKQGHAEALVPKIKNILQRAKLTFQDIGLIAVGSGPGSFTGIRVALATARGLAMAAGIPVVGVNSFEVFLDVALPQLGQENQLYVVLDARRRDLFYQVYNVQEKSSSVPKMAMSEELLKFVSQQSSLVVGTGVHRLQALAQSEQAIANCRFIVPCWENFLAVLAKKAAFAFNNNTVPESCKPYYLVPPGITFAAKI